MKDPKKLLKYLLHVAVLAGVVWAGMKTIDGDQFKRALHEFDWIYAPFIALLGVGSMVVKSWRFSTLLQEVNEIPRSVAMKAYIAGQSMTLLPGGIAARSGLLQQVGVPIEKSSPAVAMSSMTDQLGFLLCGIVASFFFEPARKPVMILLAVLAVIALVLGIEAIRTWLYRLVERLLGRFNMADKWKGFVENMSETLSWRVMAVGIANTLVSFALLVFALHLCMEGVDHSVAPLTLLLAFAVPTMLGRISALPGGIGVTEVGMVGVLDRAPGVPLDSAAAAVLVFRLGSVLFTALVGAVIYFVSWRKVSHRGKPAVAA
ncbi:MAG: lysylphosphatidylglycerol synthase transmembrane domain-containing protein [Fimbriimonas sp.]